MDVDGPNKKTLKSERIFVQDGRTKSWRGMTPMLTAELAENIVQATMQRLNRNINIMNTDGVIVASGDKRRVGERHAAAREAVRLGTTIAIDARNESEWRGAQRGVNLPIVFQGRTVGAIGITGEPDAIAEFAELVRMTTELMLRQAYLSTLQEARNRIKDTLMEELAKPSPSIDKIGELLSLLRLDARAPARAYAIAAASAGSAARALGALEAAWDAKRSIVALAPGGNALIALTFGLGAGEETRYLSAAREALARLGADASPRIALSALGRPDELPELAREAAFALTFAGRSTDGVARYEGLEPRRIAAQAHPATKARYAERLLAELNAPIRDTLQALFDCDLNVQRTADALFVHKNTVAYRLKKIREATGYDPQTFHGAAALQLALWVASGPSERQDNF